MRSSRGSFAPYHIFLSTVAVWIVIFATAFSAGDDSNGDDGDATGPATAPRLYQDDLFGCDASSSPPCRFQSQLTPFIASPDNGQYIIPFTINFNNPLEESRPKDLSPFYQFIIEALANIELSIDRCATFRQTADVESMIGDGQFNMLRVTAQGGVQCAARFGGTEADAEHQITLNERCVGNQSAVIQRLFMLAIGLPHEHVRPDRDDYISINLENVPPERRTEFDKIGTAALDVGDYDHESLLHPESNFLAMDKTLPTISAKNKNFKIGGATELSDKDVIKLKHLLCGEKLPSTSKATTDQSVSGGATSLTKSLLHLPRKLNRRTDGKSSFISPSVGDLMVTDNDGSDTIQPSTITTIPLSENTTPSLDTKPDVATLPFASVNPEEPTDEDRKSKTGMRTVTVTKTVTETMTQATTTTVNGNGVTDKMLPITKTQNVVQSTAVSRRPMRPTTNEAPETTTQSFDMPETPALPAGIPIPEMAILPTPTQNCPARQMMKLYINQTLARTSILVDGLHTQTIRDYSNYYYWNWFTPDAEDERDYLAYTVHYPLFNGAIATVRTVKFEASTRVFTTKYRIQQLPNGGSLIRKKNETRYVECADYIDELARR